MVRRQIVGLSVLAGLGWVLVVVALFIDPGLLSLGHGLLGPLFVAAQLLLGAFVWRLVGDLGDRHGQDPDEPTRSGRQE